MGRFNHEVVAVDDRTGIVYQTEDRNDSLIYRFIPQRYRELSAGGRLQASAIRDLSSADSRNWPYKLGGPGTNTIPVGTRLDTHWIDIDNPESPKDDLRKQEFSKGPTLFARGEGMWFDGRDIYLVCTNGGPNETGQVWQYSPSPQEGKLRDEVGQIELMVEPNNSDILENGDNICVAPWGDPIICEDGRSEPILGWNHTNRLIVPVCSECHTKKK